MGFFSKYNEIEKGLLDLYTVEFQKMKIPEPAKMAENLLDLAIKESKKINLPNIKKHYLNQHKKTKISKFFQFTLLIIYI